jgi:hypothetical protein
MMAHWSMGSGGLRRAFSGGCPQSIAPIGVGASLPWACTATLVVISSPRQQAAWRIFERIS